MQDWEDMQWEQVNPFCAEAVGASSSTGWECQPPVDGACDATESVQLEPAKKEYRGTPKGPDTIEKDGKTFYRYKTTRPDGRVRIKFKEFFKTPPRSDQRRDPRIQAQAARARKAHAAAEAARESAWQSTARWQHDWNWSADAWWWNAY